MNIMITKMLIRLKKGVTIEIEIKRHFILKLVRTL